MRKTSDGINNGWKAIMLFQKGKPSWNKGKKFPERSGINHHNWKGGRDITNTGYIRLQINGEAILEHRYKMEKHLKRKLKKNEVVHHKNGIKTDNRLRNLELISSNSEHMKLHRWDLGGKENIKCGYCRKEFVNFKSNKRIFCSKECYSKAQRGIKYEKKR